MIVSAHVVAQLHSVALSIVGSALLGGATAVGGKVRRESRQSPFVVPLFRVGRSDFVGETRHAFTHITQNPLVELRNIARRSAAAFQFKPAALGARPHERDEALRGP